jgi:anaerobic nitric oxide reductase flavorubredoxin
MRNTLVADGIYRLSAKVHDMLFEGIWPIPHGVSMNSYLVRGDRVAIVDGVCGWDGVPQTLFAQLAAMGIELSGIRHAVMNHLEPDHSGWLAAFLDLLGPADGRPPLEIVASTKGVEVARAFYGDDPRITWRPVKSGDTLDLGGGKVLVFEEVPNVHWPETMVTYEASTKTLMSCDAFGSFGAVADDAPFDDQLSEAQLEFFEGETLRYYSNIVSAFSLPVRKAMEKLAPLEIRVIAPGHGVVWRKDPSRILRMYGRFSRYSSGPAEPEVAVIWGSMYGMTEKGVEPVVEGIRAEGLAAHVHRVPQTHLSTILASALRSGGIVLGVPTYEYKMFPPVAHVVDDLGRKRIANRKAFRFGSYGWSGGAQKELDELVQAYRMGWDFLPPVEFKGAPGPGDLDTIHARGRELAAAVKAACSAAA